MADVSIVHKQFEATIKTINDAAHTVTALVSSPGLDRDGERILPAAFTEDLPAFMRNAVHLWGHCATDLRNVLGRAIDAQVTQDGLLVTFEYAVDANPDAAVAFGLVKSGALSAYSVGFIPVDWIVPSDTIMPEFKGARRVYTRVKLVEISLVAIPSNPEALVVGRQMDAAATEEKPKMNSQITDAAVRLHAAAATLEGGCDAESIESIAAICSSVASDLLAFAAGVEAHESHEEAEVETSEQSDVEEQPVPEKRLKNTDELRERLAAIHSACKSAMEHCEALAADAGSSDDEAEDDKNASGSDSGDGVGARDEEPTDAERNAGKSSERISLVEFWQTLKRGK